ncbi:MAG: heat-inducible transcription repressor HrcA [Lachnospiraceae bacterium]|nr:heat-inducible transcription repressor HrcA [Lachnospiraceae bacterium]
MDLDERKLKILQAIIRNYLETGEPVGSRTISKYTDLNLSSATIRNEMADLEELGYIIQPHTSAGRIPSDKGYRLYVDQMMLEKEEQLSQATQEVKDMQKLLLEREDKMEAILKQVAKMLAVNTNYATMISAPQVKGNRLKFLQISKLDETQLLVTVVIEGNVIKNHMISVNELLDDEAIWKLNLLLNTNLNGLRIEEINLAMIAKLKQQAGVYENIITAILDTISEALQNDDDIEIYTSGTNNIFKYPELADQQRASELITTFEEKQLLNELVQETLTEENSTGIQVYIGNETPIQTMKDCSVVTATYELEEGVKGTIGIIGPRRMDYDKVISTLKTLKSQLDTLYKKD